MKKIRKYLIIVQHTNYDEPWATTNDPKTALRFAIEAILDNKGKIVKIL